MALFIICLNGTRVVLVKELQNNSARFRVCVNSSSNFVRQHSSFYMSIVNRFSI